MLFTGDTLGHEVCKQFQHQSYLVDTPLDIAKSKPPEEQLVAGASADAKGLLAAKLSWVC